MTSSVCLLDEFVAAAPKGFFEDGEITLKRLSREPLLVHERQAAMIEETFEQKGTRPAGILPE